jgi:hypothetical protein
MGSIQVVHVDQLEEVIQLGPHPRHPDVQVLVVGTQGGRQPWDAACGLLDVYEDAGAFADGWPGAFVVDVKRASVRPVLRVERR